MGFIAENIMRLQLIQNLIEDENQEALFVFLDMEKAFDRCSWEFLVKGLEEIGFDSTFIDYIKLAYSFDHPPSRQMYVNGFLGPSFQLGSGVAQGCPISPLLFLIIAEPLTRLIARNPNIQGVATNNIDENGRPRAPKISQFADDSTLILRLRDITHALSNIATWCQATSMKENAAKRDILLLGSLKGHPERLPAALTLGTTPAKDGETIRALGVPMGNNFDELHWWTERYRVVKQRVTHWNGLARLSLTGRNILLQSILYGSMRYWFFTLTVPDPIVNMIESDAKELLWASNPELHGDQDGTPNGSNRYIFKEASWLPHKQGGGSIMHLPSHIKAFQAQWIIRYLDPRDSPWKDVLDHWFTSADRLGRGALMSSKGHRLIRRVPMSCTYLHACFASFYELGITQDLSLLTYQSAGEPLFKNPRFSIPLQSENIEEWVHGLHTFRLSDVASPEGLMPMADFTYRIDRRYPNGKRPRELHEWQEERHLDKHIIRMNIPRDVREMLEGEMPNLEQGTLVSIWHSTTQNSEYAVCSQDANGDAQFEGLFLDTSRYPHKTGQIITILDTDEVNAVATWDSLNKHYQEPYAGDTDPHETPKERSAIIGGYYESFPLNEGWYAKGQTPRDKNDKPRRLSDLTIHEMTAIFTNRITEGLKPNCEENWELRIGPFRFDFSLIWGSFSTPLSDPTEEKTYRRLLHRAIDAKNRHPLNVARPDYPDHKCRLRCGCNDESMLHLVQCKYVRPLWKACIKFCTEILGEKGNMLDYTKVIIFNVDRKHELLGEHTRAFLRHAVRWWYASMTKVLKENKIFVWQTCYHTTLLKFREAVIRKCVGIQRHHTHREYTPLTGIVPEEERKKYDALANIQPDGKYSLTSAFVNEITKAGGQDPAAGS